MIINIKMIASYSYMFTVEMFEKMVHHGLLDSYIAIS